MKTDPKPKYFATPATFRAWLEKNHATAQELWVGFRKKASGKASITWPESVDQALCFGWIDGIRKSVDADNYMIRFTPRRPGSKWSAVNRKKVDALTRQGLMHPAGAKAAEKRDESKAQYAFEREGVELTAAHQKRFRANKRAWEFFQSQPAYYRKIGIVYVISAVQEATRERRLGQLIAESEAGRRIGLVSSTKDKKK